MTLVHQFFLIALVCLLSNALTTTIPTQNLTLPSVEYDYQCIPKRSRFTKVPDFIDCINAFWQLSQSDDDGSFHNGPPDDPFRLPVEKTVSTCTVSVELAHQGPTREAGSWLLLVDATLRSSRECLNPWMATPRSAGAWIWFGKHRRIVVTVKYYRDANDAMDVESA